MQHAFQESRDQLALGVVPPSCWLRQLRLTCDTRAVMNGMRLAPASTPGLHGAQRDQREERARGGVAFCASRTSPPVPSLRVVEWKVG